MSENARQEREGESGRYVLRARRLADLSQRELAAHVGVSCSTVSRLESGFITPTLGLYERILAVAGLRLAVLDADGREVAPVPADTVRDNQGRRFPAHLDVMPPDEVPWERWAFPRYDRPQARGWYHLRGARDDVAQGARERERPTDHPTSSELTRRRRLMLGRQPRVDAPPPPDIVCECLDQCFEELCVTDCPCQCEPPSNDLRWRRLDDSLQSPPDAGAYLVELGEEGEVEGPS
ncbi:helix-turn-helix transcriptional regulator [Terrabacter sp. NPDC080008]|uniref:helix-turn-helix domain-containing protein n=1 Tax=Terrabacter sp. NPDC080008 TaxID=3155176 RepID=UPI003450438C